MTDTRYHTIACTDDECDPPTTYRWDVTTTGRIAERAVELAGCPIGNPRVPGGWDESFAIAEVADELERPIHDLIRALLVGHGDPNRARNDASVAIVRALVDTGRMPHPADRGVGDPRPWSEAPRDSGLGEGGPPASEAHGQRLPAGDPEGARQRP